MSNLTMTYSDFGVAQKVFSNVENIFSTRTSADNVKISDDQNTSINFSFAFNPILNRFVKIDPSQSWFWKPEWLNDEIIIENELRNGDYEEYDSIDDFIDSL